MPDRDLPRLLPAKERLPPRITIRGPVTIHASAAVRVWTIAYRVAVVALLGTLVVLSVSR